MSKYLIYIFILMIGFSMVSCSDDKDNLLTLKKAPYFGNELKIDGYYFHQRNNTGRYHIIFFYRNGVLLYGYDHEAENLERVEDLIRNGIYNDEFDIQYIWGVFEIYKDSLNFERWTPSTWPAESKPAKYYSDILNDTTFNIYKSEMSYEGNPDEVSETYQFRKFDHKPHSTNSFIK